jgi:hypothetical protein
MAMKFLRDESGYVAVLRSPFSVWRKRAAIETHSVVPAPQGTVADSTPVPAVTSHCCFFCHECGSPILLPHDLMGSPFAQPSLRRIEVRTVATVCMSCNNVGCYSLFRGCPGYDTRHKLMPAPAAGTTLLLDWLQCDASGCPFRVPLFANFDSDLSDQDKARLTENWSWHDLQCFSGHRIRRADLTKRPSAALTFV